MQSTTADNVLGKMEFKGEVERRYDQRVVMG